MAITLDHEEFATTPWTIIAELDGRCVAAFCSDSIEDAHYKMDDLLRELGYNIYSESQCSDGFIIY
jgi:hypothetical protein